MSQSHLKNPRAQYWQSQKVATAGKVITRRALEKDVAAGGHPLRQPIRQRAVARTYWTLPHPWSDSAAG